MLEIKKPGQPEKKPDPAVEIIPTEPQQKQAEVIVEIDADGKQVQPAAAPATPSISAEDFRKLQGRMEFQARQNEKLSREFQQTLEILKLQRTPATVPAEKAPADDVDAIAQQDWKKGVSILAEREAEKKFKALMAEQQATQAQTEAISARARQLETSKARVLKRYPSLSDENSEEFRVYYQTISQLYTEDPDLKNNPRAPEIAMYEMEERMRPQESPDALEAARLRRVAGGVSPQGRAISAQPKTYKLTEAEVEFCKKNKISPATFAQTKDANLAEGVSA